MPMLPSSSSALPQVPAPGIRSKTEASITAAPRSRGDAHRRRRDVDAERQPPAAGEREDVAAGAAADVEHGRHRAVEDRLVGPRQRTEPALQRQAHGAAIRPPARNGVASPTSARP